MGKSPGKKILLIENDAEEILLIRALFNDQSSSNFELTCVRSVREAEDYLSRHSVDIVLLDLGLTDPKGLQAFRRFRAFASRISVVLLSSLDDEPIAVQAVQEGAHDYFIKGQIEPEKLRLVLTSAPEHIRIEEVSFKESEPAPISLERVSDAQIFAGPSGNIILLNPIAERMTGWALKESVGRLLTEVFRIVDVTNRKAIPVPTATVGWNGKEDKPPLNCLLIHRDGNEYFIEHSASLVHNHEGKVAGTVIVFRDVRSVQARPERISHFELHDVLTGLPNRLPFYDRVERAILLAGRHKGYAAVLFLNLDEIERVSGSLGHLAGDKLLQSVANRLRGCLRTQDTVSRLGGEEFVMLLQDVHRPEDAAATAARLLQAVAASDSVDDRATHHRKHRSKCLPR